MSSLPDILRPSALDRPANQRLNTSILYPVISNQKQLVFVFPRNGILDSNSRLNLKLNMSNLAGGDDVCVPQSLGCSAWLKRCYLSVGGRVVSNLTDANAYNLWERLHQSPDYRDGILLPTQGGRDTFVGSDERAYPKAQNWGTLGRRDRAGEHTTLPAVNVNPDNESQQIDARPSGSAGNPEYSVPLSQICPLLRGLQLPLFAINQDVSLTIEFAGDGTQPNDLGVRYVNNDTPVGAGGTSAFDLPKCYVMMDSLYYDGQMEAVAEQVGSKEGYNVYFDEILTQLDTEVWVAGTPSTHTHHIQVSGKKVKNLIFQNAGQTLLNAGTFNSQAPIRGVEYNASVDSVPVYTENLTNPALQFSETDALDGKGLSLPSWRYSYTGQTNVARTDNPVAMRGFTDREYNEHSQQEESGSQFWTGIRFENADGEGKVMSSLPIVLTRKLDPQALTGGGSENRTNVLRTFITTQRLLNVGSGGVSLVE